MNDQAHDLRNLISQDEVVDHDLGGVGPRIVAVLGGQGRVGTTTLAVNLSAYLASQQLNTVLVQVQFSHGNNRTANLNMPRSSPAHLSSQRNEIASSRDTGPCGLRLVPYDVHDGQFQRQQINHLLSETRRKYGNATTVVVDGGAKFSPIVTALVGSACRTLVVTTVEKSAVLETYAMIKALSENTRMGKDQGCRARLGLVINRTVKGDNASEVFGRISTTCRRFLGETIELVANVPTDEEISAELGSLPPYLQKSPNRPVARCMSRIARSLAVNVRRAVVNAHDPDSDESVCYI